MSRRVYTILFVFLLGGIVSVWATPPDRPASPDLPAFVPSTSVKTVRYLAPYLTWGVKAEIEYLRTIHTARPSGSTGDAASLAPELSLELSLAPSRYLQSLIAVKLLGEFNYISEEPDQNATGFELTEAFLLLRPLWNGRLALQIGRQKFTDAREW